MNKFSSNIEKNAFYRTGLKERCGKRFTFYATVDRVGFGYRKPDCFNLLLKNVYIDNEKVAEHIWLSNIDFKHITCFKLGNEIKFSATVYRYEYEARCGLKDIGYFEILKGSDKV